MSSTLDKLKELEAAATPGPWRRAARQRTPHPQIRGADMVGPTGDPDAFDWGRFCTARSEADRDLFVFLRNHTADFIALWEAAEEFDRTGGYDVIQLQGGMGNSAVPSNKLRLALDRLNGEER